MPGLRYFALRSIVAGGRVYQPGEDVGAAIDARALPRLIESFQVGAMPSDLVPAAPAPTPPIPALDAPALQPHTCEACGRSFASGRALSGHRTGAHR